MLRRSGVRVFTMRDVDKHGIARVVEMAIEAVGSSMDNPLHLSLDIDSVDPHFAPCVRIGPTSRGPNSPLLQVACTHECSVAVYGCAQGHGHRRTRRPLLPRDPLHLRGACPHPPARLDGPRRGQPGPRPATAIACKRRGNAWRPSVHREGLTYCAACG